MALGVGCGTLAPTPDPPQTVPPSTTAPPRVTDTTAGPLCATGDLAFSDEGVIATVGGDGADAAAVNELRFDTELRCDRLVIGFATSNGSPASALGPTVIELLPSLGILRVSLPDGVATTSVSEATVDGSVIAQAVVVRMLDGTLAIDLHLDATQGVAARSFLVGSPPRLVMDVRAGDDGPQVSRPSGDADTVVLTPRGGVADYPLVVNGYTRAAAVTVGLSGGTMVTAVRAAEVADEGTPWAEFEATIPNGLSGTVDLVVDTASADGDTSRITVLLDLP
ncbi:MAG: hypothetical protein H0V96_01180 [Acidimicrobiia bacterium]|nr:hypothetical protein [Acidimicrobiia bacterium]